MRNWYIPKSYVNYFSVFCDTIYSLGLQDHHLPCESGPSLSWADSFMIQNRLRAVYDRFHVRQKKGKLDNEGNHSELHSSGRPLILTSKISSVLRRGTCTIDIRPRTLAPPVKSPWWISNSWTFRLNPASSTLNAIKMLWWTHWVYPIEAFNTRFKWGLAVHFCSAPMTVNSCKSKGRFLGIKGVRRAFKSFNLLLLL